MRRSSADRFRKLSFWPGVEIDGEIQVDRQLYWKHWSDDPANWYQGPTPTVHSVFDEPDFRSIWGARDQALLLETALHQGLFDVEFH